MSDKNLQIIDERKVLGKDFNLTGKKSPTSIGGAMNCPIVFWRQSDII